MPYVWVKFTEGKRYNLVRANKDGLATYKCTSDNVSASFHDVSELTKALKPIWAESSNTNRADWLKPVDGKVTVVSPRAGVLQQYLPGNAASETTEPDKTTEPTEKFAPFEAVALTAGKEHQISVQPHVTLVRLIGVNFDTDKCFLLPTALPTMRRIKELFDEHRRDSLMIVGHADTTGGIAHNQDISLDRAAAVWSFLRDDVEGWLSWYDSSVSTSCRWGSGEDRQMLRGLVARKQGLLKPETKDYQVWHNALADDKKARNWSPLEEDGKFGDLTRAQLIGDYMNLDGTTLPEDCEVWLHGCGESFPLPEPAAGNAWERFSELRNRRVEFLFFDETTDVSPIPAVNKSTAASTEYPTWLAKAEVEDLTTEAGLKEVTFVEMHDALFRTNSAVVLPDGEDPTLAAERRRSQSTVGLITTAIWHVKEHPTERLLITGHTDTKGTVEFNQKLSEERAEAVWALLMGNCQRFAELANDRHDDLDLTQIFDWCADVFGFTCKPSRRDRPPSTVTIRAFQESYNHWLATMADLGAKPTQGDLIPPNGTTAIPVDGSVSPETWQAIAFCYEAAVRAEFLMDESAISKVREDIQLLDTSRPWLGLSEHHPVDNLGRDNYRSQANRRVEILFFEPSTTLDLDVALKAPDTFEPYLPGLYRRTIANGPELRAFIQLRSPNGIILENAATDVRYGTEGSVSCNADGNGLIELQIPAHTDSLSIRMTPTDPSHPSHTEYEWHYSIGRLAHPGSALGAMQRLQRLGYLNGPVLLTWNDECRAALGRFQRDYNVSATALLDSPTIHELNRAGRFRLDEVVNK